MQGIFFVLSKLLLHEKWFTESWGNPLGNHLNFTWNKQGMTEKSKDYFLKTSLAFVLMGVGAWGVNSGIKLNVILGAICFAIGFLMCAFLFGNKWLC